MRRPNHRDVAELNLTRDKCKVRRAFMSVIRDMFFYVTEAPCLIYDVKILLLSYMKQHR